MSPNFLTLSFSPTYKYLTASLQHPVTSDEYRSGIRTIAACVAKLRAELLLLDFSEIETLSMEDQHYTANFLQQELQNTTLRRSARVLPNSNSLWFVYRLLMEEIKGLPYEANAFTSDNEAIVWLFEGKLNKGEAPVDLVPVPLLPEQVEEHSSASSPPLPATTDIPDNGVLCRTDYVEISLHTQQSYLAVRWLRSVESAEYRFGIQETGRFLLLFNLEKLLVDNQRLGNLTMSDQNWLAQISMEVISKSRLKRLAVMSSYDLNQLIADEALDLKVKSTANLSFDTRYFFSEDEALEWLSLPEEAPELRWQQQFPQPTAANMSHPEL